MGCLVSTVSKCIEYFSFHKTLLKYNSIEEYSSIIEENLKIGDIVLTYSKGNLSNWIIGGKYKHSVVYIGKGIIENGKMVLNSGKEDKLIFIESSGGIGVHLLYVNDLIVDKHSLLILNNEFLKNDLQVTEFVEKIQTFVGREYDYEFYHGNDSFYCSELITHTLKLVVGEEEFYKKMGKKQFLWSNTCYGSNMYQPEDYKQNLSKKFELVLERIEHNN